MFRPFFLSFFIYALSGLVSHASPRINYELRFPEPQTHYVNVRMQVSGWSGERMVLKMPVWAPGSYLVREFSRHVEQLSVTDSKGQVVSVARSAKNTWEFDAAGSSSFIISYFVYAYELTVRTSFIDEEHAYLNGTSIFLYAESLKSLPCTVKVFPFPAWKVMSVALDPVSRNSPWEVVANDYDELVDSPFEIGNHTVFSFTASGVPHEVAMFGYGNYDAEKLKKDMSRIVEECTSVFGSHPCKRYLFIIHNLVSGGGGLEHLNSTTLQTNRWSYGNASSYNAFLSLVAHEYFHLWNVKRLRPQPLGPFDYDRENYTTMLWLAEGFTAYYDDLIVRRCGFTSETEYLATLAGNMSYCTNTPGSSIQALSESSYDTWIKFYRPNENSSNSTVSYYTKGAVAGALLDMEIMYATKGKYALDDVFREMYRNYYLDESRPYSEQDFIRTAEKTAGIPLWAFIQKLVHSTDTMPFHQSLVKVGLSVQDQHEIQSKPWTGLNTSFSNGRLTVTSVERNSPGWTGGINVNDELIGIDEFRLADDFSKLLSMKKPGDTVKVTLSRNGLIKVVPIRLERNPAVSYLLTASDKADESAAGCYRKWLRVP